jgi:DNA-binding GntR family transcriptional regulator
MDRKTPLNVKSLKEQVYEYLREQMRRGEILPGSVIDMEETSRRLGISKTPLRDALLMLEMENFVSILPRRKVVVNVLSFREIRNIYEIIGALESMALMKACERLLESDLPFLQEMNDGMKKAIDGGDFDLYYERNLAFHGLFLERGGNERLVQIVRTLKKRLYDFPRREGFVKEWEESSIEEHQAIIEFIRKGKCGEAAEFIRDVHWSFKIQEKFIGKYYLNASGSAT